MRLVRAARASLVARIALGAALSCATTGWAETVLGAALPQNARQVAERRYRSPMDWEGTLKFYRQTYPAPQYPRRHIINQPGVKAIHIANGPGRGAWEGLNVIEANQEVRIYVVPADPPGTKRSSPPGAPKSAPNGASGQAAAEPAADANDGAPTADEPADEPGRGAGSPTPAARPPASGTTAAALPPRAAGPTAEAPKPPEKAAKAGRAAKKPAPKRPAAKKR